MGNEKQEENGEKRQKDGDGEVEEKIPYPKSIFFILSMEACERFSYYGMRTVLSLYLKYLFTGNGMKNDDAEDLATSLYHGFVFFCYFFSLFGAYLADSFLGKFKTIFYISIIYTIGQAVLSLGSFPDTECGILGMPQEAISFIGLFLIAFGTGGIKPCVVSFGAEQFTLPQQEPQMSSFFNIFYFSINFGSMISTILTPIFRSTPCLGEAECYPLAFGVPAALMFVALVSFLLGRPGYKVKVPERNIVAEFSKTCWCLMRKRSDEAEDRFGAKFVADCRAVLGVGVIFFTFPMFWALFDQTGSRFTFQAAAMDGEIWEGAVIKPDQMQVVNAACILLFIPLFDKLIYPLFNKCGMLTKPLQKIATGMFVIASSFVVATVIEIVLEKTYPAVPGEAGGSMLTSRLAFHNSLPPECNLALNVTQADVSFEESIEIGGTKSNWFRNGDEALLPFKWEKGTNFTVTIDGTVTGGDACFLNNQELFTKQVEVNAGTSQTVTFYGTQARDIVPAVTEDQIEKSSDGYPEIRVIANLPTWTDRQPLNIFLAEDDYKSENDLGSEADLCDVGKDGKVLQFKDIENNQDRFDTDFGTTVATNKYFKVCVQEFDDASASTKCATVRGKTYFEEIMDQASFEEPSLNSDYGSKFFKYDLGGSYNLYIGESEGDELLVDIEEVTQANSLHMMWLLPQYIILTCGEILFSITGLEFAYTQSPTTMKAVVQALYLLTTAGGNLIDWIVVAALSPYFKKQWHEFLTFASIMVLDALILVWLAIRYKYVDYSSSSGDELTDEQRKKEALQIHRRASVASLDH